MNHCEKDYYRPVYHITPPSGWMNDPNGLIQFKGKYHVFYQYYPDAPRDGPKHWGHVRSDDMIHWEQLPIALKPDAEYEQGCWSGSAVDNNGELTLIYTAHHDGRNPKETQCAAFSSDGVNFVKYENNPVINGPPGGFGDDFRDPKVFRRGELWYMVAGCTRDNRGGILCYASRDLRHWDCFGLLCQSDGTQGIMWECPDFFELGDEWVLLCSPIRMEGSKCIFLSGGADFRPGEKKAVFTRKAWQDADYGPDFYAPQTFEDDRGRRILIGWMDLWNTELITAKDGWIGALTFPRELYRGNGRIKQRPVEELALLRKKCLLEGNKILKDGQKNNLTGITGETVEIAFSLPAMGKGHVSLSLRAHEQNGEKTVLEYDFGSRTFTIDTTHSGAGKTFHKEISAEKEEEITIHILVDKSSVEFFLCGYAASCRIYPSPESVFYDIAACGADIQITDLRIYALVIS